MKFLSAVLKTNHFQMTSKAFHFIGSLNDLIRQPRFGPRAASPLVLYPRVCSHYCVDLPWLHLASYYVTLHLVMNSIPLRGIMSQGWFEISICNSSDNKQAWRSWKEIRFADQTGTLSSIESSYPTLPDRKSRKHDKVSSLRCSAIVQDIFAEWHTDISTLGIIWRLLQEHKRLHFTQVDL